MNQNPSRLRILLSCLVTLVSLTCGCSAHEEAICSWEPPRTALQGRIVEHRFKEFREGRRVRVYLPAEYGVSSYEYPTIYMLDGEELFQDANLWLVDRTIDHLVATSAFRGAVVVGIDDAGEGNLRRFEYVPWFGGHQFLTGVRDTLMPLITRSYRVRSGRNHQFIAGASLGGLCATYAAFQFDSTFGGAASFSASYGYPSLVDEAVRRGTNGQSCRFYQDTGTVDDNSVARLYDIQRAATEAGLVEGVDMLTVVSEGQTHHPACWRGRVPQAFQFLLARIDSVGG